MRNLDFNKDYSYANPNSKNVEVSNCYNTCSVTSNTMPGGIIGLVNAGTVTINNCYNTANLVNNSNLPVGGVLGFMGSGTVIIANCYNTGNVTSSECAGGITGKGSSSGTVTIKNCYNFGNITGGLAPTGGIAGWFNSGTIENCYNKGNIECGNLAGGIVGSGPQSLTNCYNTGNVTSPYSNYVFPISGSTLNVGEGCAYGANAISLSDFITRLNNYVVTNNSNSSNIQLKEWRLNNKGNCVFLD